MDKFLIIGSKGSLGSEFLNILKNENVTALDKDKLDITDEKAVKETITSLTPNIVINCAAYNLVDKAEEERLIANEINGYAPGHLAKACDLIGAKIVHISSGYVFNGNNPEGYNEDDPTDPVNAYGKSKLLGEVEISKNTEDFYIVRTSRLFGRGGAGPAFAEASSFALRASEDRSAGKKKTFVDLIIEKAKERNELDLVSDEFGSPTYTLDLAQAIVALIRQNSPFGIYHLTNSGSISWLDWAREIFRIKNMEVKLNAVSGESFARPAKRPKFEILNNKKFIKLRPWIEALNEYLNESK